MNFPSELRAAVHRKSAWVLWIITAVICFAAGHLARYGWHW